MPGMPNLPAGAPPMGQPRTSGLAIAGFICAFFCSLLGFVLSLLGYNQCKRSNGMVKGQGLAIAGMAISGILFFVGILAAVAIPAFMDYMHKAKKTESQLQLNKIMKNAKVFYVTENRFPVFDQELTPAASCCTQTAAKCQPQNDHWDTDAWRALDFEIDEPHLYRYGFKSDGETLDAVAVGDLDCDGTEATFRLHMTSKDGMVQGTIEQPPAGTY
jgi:type II secretory pathway pseudopilin PulG